MKGQREFVGTLLGFDDYVSAYSSLTRHGPRERNRIVCGSPFAELTHSEATDSGFHKTRLSRTLLNGNNIVAVRALADQLVPGGQGPDA